MNGEDRAAARAYWRSQPATQAQARTITTLLALTFICVLLIALAVVGGTVFTFIAVSRAASGFSEAFGDIGFATPAIGGQTVVPTPSGPPPNAGEEARTLQGRGDVSTEPFAIAGGRYTLSYNYDGDCFFAPSLHDPLSGEPVLFTSLPTSTGAASGQDNLYGVPAGTYYLDMITGSSDCTWSLTFTPAGR